MSVISNDGLLEHTNEECVAEADMWKDVLLRRDMCFLGSRLEKGHVMFCYGRRLRAHVMFGKGVSITQQTVALVHLITLCWSPLGFADAGLCC